MGSEFVAVVIAVAAMVLVLMGFLVIMLRFYRRIGPNEALVVTTPNGALVARRGRIIFPFLHTAESIDLATKQLRIERKGRDAPTTTDGIQADLVVVFYLHVAETEDDILKAARKIGAERLRDASALKELLAPQLASNVDTLARHVAFERFERDREELEKKLQDLFSGGIDGLTLDRAVIERVERTPVDQAGPFR